MKIRQIDKDIMNVLVEDSRLSLRDIAKRVKVSAVTVLNRLKNLEKDKLIKRYTAKINYEALGYDLMVIINIRIAKGKLLEVEKKIATDHHVVAVYDILGQFDSTIIARFSNRRSLDVFLKKVQSFDFVERTETNIVLNTVKDKDMELI